MQQAPSAAASSTPSPSRSRSPRFGDGGGVSVVTLAASLATEVVQQGTIACRYGNPPCGTAGAAVGECAQTAGLLVALHQIHCPVPLSPLAHVRARLCTTDAIAAAAPPTSQESSDVPFGTSKPMLPGVAAASCCSAAFTIELAAASGAPIADEERWLPQARTCLATGGHYVHLASGIRTSIEAGLYPPW